MDTKNNVRLRLRFYQDMEEPIDQVRAKFEQYAEKPAEDYKISVCDNHIWMNIKGGKKQYWSPHLHIELEPRDKGTHIRGLFGPDQTLWTFFMFLHFLVAGVFIIFGMMLYSHIGLRQPYTFDLIIMGLMVLVWMSLYLIARQIRSKGYGQMDELESLLAEILK